MAPRNPHKDDEMMLLAAWDLLGDVCLTHAVVVAYDVCPTRRRGVFTLRLKAFRAGPNDKLRKVANWTQEFPCSQTQSFAGAFFRAANQLDALLTDQAAADVAQQQGAGLQGMAD